MFKTSEVLYKPKTSYKIDRIEVVVDENNRFINEYKMENFVRDNPEVSSDGFAVAVLNDNVASIVAEIFFECVTENHVTGHFGVVSYKILHFKSSRFMILTPMKILILIALP
jgi:hypothetical protein